MAPKSDTPQSDIQNLLIEAANAASDSAAVKTMLHGVLLGMIKIHDRIDELEDKFCMMKGAFPAGDAEGHRRAHEAMIASIESRQRLTQAIIEKTIPALFWAALAVIGAALWNHFVNAINNGRVK